MFVKETEIHKMLPCPRFVLLMMVVKIIAGVEVLQAASPGVYLYRESHGSENTGYCMHLKQTLLSPQRLDHKVIQEECFDSGAFGIRRLMNTERYRREKSLCIHRRR